jgi:hypothetical protein
MLHVFTMGANSTIIANTGGRDGTTWVGSLELAASKAIRTYIKTGGNIKSSVSNAQEFLKERPDKGDRESVLRAIPER